VRPIIFLGPTLSVTDAARELDADYQPPVRMGCVIQAARRDPPAIGIVDGYFDRVPAVWHKEILWALSRGISVFGAASLGALRAAELADFGMIGVGEIYNAYRRGDWEDDDEVALVHADASQGYLALSEPMANIRATLAKAVRCGVITPATGDALVAVGKAQFYPERVWPRLLAQGRANGLDGAQLEALGAWVRGHAVNLKGEDALQMLRVIRDHLQRGAPPVSAAFDFEETTLWKTAVSRTETADRAVLDEFFLDLELQHQILDAIQARWELVERPRALLEELRRRGLYDQLADRGAQKSRTLAELGLEQPAPGLTGLAEDDLLAWLFHDRLGGWPEDVAAFLRERGWTSERELGMIAAREYLLERESRQTPGPGNGTAAARRAPGTPS
jgi:hypothetical protein